MIERVVSTGDGGVLVGRDTDTGALLIHCIDGAVIEVPAGAEISVDDTGHGILNRLCIWMGAPDTVPPHWAG